MFRRLICTALVLLMLPGLCIAEGAEQTFVMAGFDGQNSNRDWNTNDFFVRMEERTGISFTFQQYNDSSSWQSAKDEMFANGQLPDVFFKAALTNEELIRYTDSGQLIDLKPLLQEHAPNFWAHMEEHPEWLAAITLPNGKIGALPSIDTIAGQNLLWINQQWLDNLGLEMPTDFDSLRTVLAAFRDNDPNQNGKKDEVPLTFLGPWDLKFFSHAYGVVANDYNLYVDDAGKVHFWPDEDSFFLMASTLRDLYKDGLIDKNGFYSNDTLRQYMETGDEKPPVYGMFFAADPIRLAGYANATQYVAVPPFTCDGRQVYRNLFGNLGFGTFAISSACSDPAAMLAWVDHLYSADGAVEAMAGRLDVNYYMDASGYWTWKSSSGSALSSNDLSSITVYDTGMMPWCFPADFYILTSVEPARKVAVEINNYSPYLVKPFPYFTLTGDEKARIQPLQDALGRYVDEGLARFVLGQVELNEANIAAFRQGLKERGMDEMLLLWQSVADRAITQE
ncbi:MAG: extracellular solute-binding protein [Clostridiales bacterium]|nr:extracellular solute-binding protein [Clostridiales bacterium]